MGTLEPNLPIARFAHKGRRFGYVQLARWGCSVIVGLTFVTAGWGKLRDPLPTAQVIESVGTPREIAEYTVWVLPGLEIASGLGLLLFARSRLVYAVSALLLVLFIGFLLVLQRVDPGATCGCFAGPIEALTSGGPVAAIVRNLFLLAILMWAAWPHLQSDHGGQMARARVTRVQPLDPGK